MLQIITAFVLLLFTSQVPAQTKFYQCKDQWGQPVYSQRPCGSDAQEKSVTAHDRISGDGDFKSSTESPAPSAPSATATTQTYSIEVTRDKRRLSEIKEDIKRRERRIEQYADERDERIAVLQLKTRYANNNLAGATWQESLASEMSAVATQYDTKIDQQQEKIDDLKEETNDIKTRLAAG